MTIIGTFEHLINREPWAAEGTCRQVDPEIFFPEKGQSARDAKRVCANCPVAAECLEYALVNGERSGIFGGYSERERRRMLKGVA